MSGAITSKELKDFLNENKVCFQNEEMDKLISEIDVNDDADINLVEFKAALLIQKNKKDDQNDKD